MGREWPGVDLLLRTLLQVGGIVEFATNHHVVCSFTVMPGRGPYLGLLLVESSYFIPAAGAGQRGGVGADSAAGGVLLGETRHLRSG